MIMKKIILILSLFVFFAVALPVSAKTTLSPTLNVEINAFELFWPIVAGKVQGDSFYSLKTFKERVREILIIGESKKSEYFSFLSTKRLVEYGELVLNRKDFENANKTLSEYKENLGKGNNLEVFEKQKLYFGLILEKVDESQKSAVKEGLSTLDSRIEDFR